MSYKNNGPKNTSADYLVVNGSRVYTGEKFEASDEDVSSLSKNFNIKSLKTEHKDVVSTPKDEVVKVGSIPKDSQAQFQTEEDALASTSKNSNPNKGVK